MTGRTCKLLTDSEINNTDKDYVLHGSLTLDLFYELPLSARILLLLFSSDKKGRTDK